MTRSFSVLRPIEEMNLFSAIYLHFVLHEDEREGTTEPTITSPTGDATTP